MSLSIKLISTSDNTGVIIIGNKMTTTLTNWYIKIKPENFDIVSADNIEILSENGIYKIMPKAWKINIEEDTKIISDFVCNKKNNQDLEYKIVDIHSEPTENKKVEILVVNNTEEAIVIQPGETYKFLV